MMFCVDRNYKLDAENNNERLAFILKDWAFNMRKIDGSDYKESVIKTIWNTTAKLVQEKYFCEYQRHIDPFKDITFKEARAARDSKRKLLQTVPDKRKMSSVAMTSDEYKNMCLQWDEDTPEGLQKKFFHIAAVELAWRGNEASFSMLHFFKEETNNKGCLTNRIAYNPIFSKTRQGGDKNCADNKWLTQNLKNPEMCPVRLYRKLISKRETITNDRLFLTVNGKWNKYNNSNWYKNCLIGINTISKRTKMSAEKIGLDTKKVKITNHSKIRKMKSLEESQAHRSCVKTLIDRQRLHGRIDSSLSRKKNETPLSYPIR
uniref:Uncharacterized protein LOC114326168 n=1 Tax=Diabrotica virgifera virgifera TaxID=50390 RepID=A0A6P7F496_DIAVI